MRCGYASREYDGPTPLVIRGKEKEFNSYLDQTGCLQKPIFWNNQHMPSRIWQREVFYMTVEINLGLVQRDGWGK